MTLKKPKTQLSMGLVRSLLPKHAVVPRKHRGAVLVLGDHVRRVRGRPRRGEQGRSAAVCVRNDAFLSTSKLLLGLLFLQKAPYAVGFGFF